MNGGGSKKARTQRVAGRDPVPKSSARVWRTVCRSDVVLRALLCLGAAVIMAIATRAWAPPFAYREGYTPPRNIVARVDFTEPNPTAEDRAQEAVRRQARHVYINDPQPLRQLRASLRGDVAELLEAEQFDEKAQELWDQFLPRPQPDPELADEENARRQQQWQKAYEHFRFALSGNGRLKFDTAVEAVFGELEKNGLFEKPQDSNQPYPGNPLEIFVYPEKDWDARQPVEITEVQITYVKPKLQDNLRRQLETLENEVKENRRRQARQTFVHNPQPLTDLRSNLHDQLLKLAAATELDEETAKLWRAFLPRETAEEPLPSQAEQQKLFEQFRTAIAEQEDLEGIEAQVAEALADYERRGLLLELKTGDDAPEGNLEEIYVITPEDEATRVVVPVADVRLADIKPQLREKLEKQLKSVELAGRMFAWLEHELPTAATLEYRATPDADAAADGKPLLAELTYQWLQDRLTPTLMLDKNRTKEIQDLAAAGVLPEDHATHYYQDKTVLAMAGQPLDEETIRRLRFEYDQILTELPASQMLGRLLAALGMYLAIYTLCGLFIYFRFPDLLTDMRRFASLLALSMVTVAICYLMDNWHAEMIPLLLFGMTLAIAYNQELALLLAAAVGLVVVLSLGQGLVAFVVLTAATATAVLMLRRVRSRVKLVYVGVAAGAVATLTTLGVKAVAGWPFGLAVLQEAGLNGLWGIAAGFAMTGLLPFIENIFGVLTDISLLELGDVAHPLLQELVRRAPGTYNHSINVASMAEAAAESIGAQGLLARVGAYFHDIGKMLKPQYFVENQSDGDNRHESLVPAMSTLIIIAHVKDGADLARQHHLPQPIIDFIQQHHGTTLVEYFYRRASEDSQRDPESGDVDENTFRYPGPKPQTKESGILMLADAVESASRVLVEPTPSRIESLVEDIAMKRLLDGQLDECGLTLREVRTVQESLVKSLTAVYHGRVKYPDQMTA